MTYLEIKAKITVSMIFKNFKTNDCMKCRVDELSRLEIIRQVNTDFSVWDVTSAGQLVTLGKNDMN